MIPDADHQSDYKTRSLRGVYAGSDAQHKQLNNATVIMNPDAMEFYAAEIPLLDDADFADAVEEAQEIVDAAIVQGRTFSETEEKRLAQLFAIGIDCEDLGLSYQDLLRLRKGLD